MIGSAIKCLGLLIEERYRVIRQIGSGGFGQVFEVDDDGTPKVLKVLRLERFDDPNVKNKAMSLFQREAEFLSRQQHPGIPRVESTGYFTCTHESQAPLHCLLMEKIAGSNLQEWLLARGNQPITTEEAIAWLTQLVEILDHLHKQQYFHRDIKPSNIMLKPDGQLVLVDFGAIREVTETYLHKQKGDETGTVLISAGYTPPEQLEGHAVPQSDFFALGRTFVYLLTGKSPLDFPKNPQTGELIWRNYAPQVSPQLADLIDHLMAPFIGGRPQDSQVILDYLAEIKQNSRFRWQNLVGKLRGNPSLVHRRTATTAKVDRRYSRVAKLTLAGLFLLGGSSLLWKQSPEIAAAFNKQGIENYQRKNWDVSNRAPAYCLKAQVLERQKNKEEALLAWGNCLKYADAKNLDERRWINLAPHFITPQGALKNLLSGIGYQGHQSINPAWYNWGLQQEKR